MSEVEKRKKNRGLSRGSDIQGIGNSNKPTRPIGISVSDIAREDFDSKADALILSSDQDFNELSSFLGTNIAQDEKHLLIKQTNPEITSKGYRVVWVENPITREYVRVEVSSSKIDKKLNSLSSSGIDYSNNSTSSNNDNSDNINISSNSSRWNHGSQSMDWIVPPPIPLKGHVDEELQNEINHIKENSFLAEIVKLIYAFIQGILAGFCFLPVFLAAGASNSDNTFLMIYQPIAQDTRTFFYLLSSISCVGSWDMFLTILSQSKLGYKSSKERISVSILSLLISILQSIGFIVTIVISKYDVLIADMFGQSSTSTVTWETAVLSNSQYKGYVNAWKPLAYARLVVCLIAWVLFCLLLSQDYARNRRKSKDLEQLKAVANAWKRRTHVMEGKDLESLDDDELQKLSMIQQLGLDRVNNLIAISKNANINIILSPDKQSKTILNKSVVSETIATKPTITINPNMESVVQ